jgi:LacI family transcriptional regulator
LVKAEPRRGYRVLARANDPDRGSPLAFVVSGDNDPDFYGDLLRAMQGAAAQRKWSLLGVQRDGRSIGEIIEHLRTARACGAVVDSTDNELLAETLRLGIPVVMADTWQTECRCDAVAQDSLTGAMLAAEWLAQRGHTRIAYVGLSPQNSSIVAAERYAGTVAGLARAGLSLDPSDVIHVPTRDKVGEMAAVKELLNRPDRPTAVLALWQGIGLVVAHAAREMGLLIGRDLDMVGWSLKEVPNPRELLDAAGAGSLLATVTWSAADLADLCLTRLMQRREAPHLPFSLTRVPVRLNLLEVRQSE